MLSAYDRTLGYDPKDPDKVVVPRGINPSVPREWLLAIFAFSWPLNMKANFALKELA